MKRAFLHLQNFEISKTVNFLWIDWKFWQNLFNLDKNEFLCSEFQTFKIGFWYFKSSKLPEIVHFSKTKFGLEKKWFVQTILNSRKQRDG